MHGLEKGINQLATQETDQKVRKNAIDLLNGIIDDLNAGIDVWNDLLNKGIPQTETGGFGGWAGFTVETKLFELELNARNKAKEASNGQSSLDEPLVALAYKKLSEGELPEDAARAAISTMEDRIEHVKSLISAVQNTTPKKPVTVKKAAKKPAKAKAKAVPAKKKPAKKKATKKKTTKKKPAKKAAKKKAAKKTTKKKAVKKKAAKKKAGKKKAAKKKAARKKAATKKPAKKKTTKKKAVKKKKTKRR